jgi:hypothetical protein
LLHVRIKSGGVKRLLYPVDQSTSGFQLGTLPLQVHLWLRWQRRPKQTPASIMTAELLEHVDLLFAKTIGDKPGVPYASRIFLKAHMALSNLACLSIIMKNQLKSCRLNSNR